MARQTDRRPLTHSLQKVAAQQPHLREESAKSPRSVAARVVTPRREGTDRSDAAWRRRANGTAAPAKRGRSPRDAVPGATAAATSKAVGPLSTAGADAAAATAVAPARGAASGAAVSAGAGAATAGGASTGAAAMSRRRRVVEVAGLQAEAAVGGAREEVEQQRVRGEGGVVQLRHELDADDELCGREGERSAEHNAAAPARGQHRAGVERVAGGAGRSEAPAAHPEPRSTNVAPSRTPPTARSSFRSGTNSASPYVSETKLWSSTGGVPIHSHARESAPFTAEPAGLSDGARRAGIHQRCPSRRRRPTFDVLLREGRAVDAAEGGVVPLACTAERCTLELSPLGDEAASHRPAGGKAAEGRSRGHKRSGGRAKPSAERERGNAAHRDAGSGSGGGGGGCGGLGGAGTEVRIACPAFACVGSRVVYLEVEKKNLGDGCDQRIVHWTRRPCAHREPCMLERVA